TDSPVVAEWDQNEFTLLSESRFASRARTPSPEVDQATAKPSSPPTTPKSAKTALHVTTAVRAHADIVPGSGPGPGSTSQGPGPSGATVGVATPPASPKSASASGQPVKAPDSAQVKKMKEQATKLGADISKLGAEVNALQTRADALKGSPEKLQRQADQLRKEAQEIEEGGKQLELLAKEEDEKATHTPDEKEIFQRNAQQFRETKAEELGKSNDLIKEATELDEASEDMAKNIADIGTKIQQKKEDLATAQTQFKATTDLLKGTKFISAGLKPDQAQNISHALFGVNQKWSEIAECRKTNTPVPLALQSEYNAALDTAIVAARSAAFPNMALGDAARMQIAAAILDALPHEEACADFVARGFERDFTDTAPDSKGIKQPIANPRSLLRGQQISPALYSAFLNKFIGKGLEGAPFVKALTIPLQKSECQFGRLLAKNSKNPLPSDQIANQEKSAVATAQRTFDGMQALLASKGSAEFKRMNAQIYQATMTYLARAQGGGGPDGKPMVGKAAERQADLLLLDKTFLRWASPLITSQLLPGLPPGSRDNAMVVAKLMQNLGNLKTESTKEPSLKTCSDTFVGTNEQAVRTLAASLRGVV
ncbi:MAG TPA: hypothetical protein VN457_04945, partial [Chlamydiales bacterium]|nr:hypothetical protein [Chlamydiales bacterium]